ncbi:MULTISPECIES: peptidoglycan editing factor PgeF [unclassified Synechococcus]|uniref:peptidoglycan editing factor PgeF n=1 Tax=unclassified Synechococcus TaxID=2626047 RepID=UPI0021A5FEAE|nr:MULTISPECIES: peptidoglycan editing factor PgeF [unclassified Synechococcus]MCT0213036.1 peptidoglycan editing factor PgeF [Synechococcus sp. CS-1326]MCT0232281.1 peptidoglycan editing factor PgeF [Synechococcus sp. CS-1327]
MAEAVEAPFDRPDRTFNSLPGWTWVGTYGGYFLQADRLADFEHGFFTRQWGGRGPEELAGAISAGVSVHRTRQVHGAKVLGADLATGEPWPAADGLFSREGGQSLWVCGADCTPVLFADGATGQVSACHAGWRGVAGRILPEAIEQMERLGSRREDLQVALGPAIHGAAYQVHADVALEVAASLVSAGLPDLLDASSDRLARLEPLQRCGALSDDPQPDRFRLDIRAAAAQQLRLEGLSADQISVCPLCTAAEPLLFHSWRRDQVKAVQWSGIVAQA